ncbi:hypothetical protein Q4506_12815 [Colwellia sp. 4_MG-2023]|uniref:hypothetical protein n=1 Tax=unclassified Colwellia TaxID=196834 RepID=UPI001C094026|nr:MULTISPECIES: hypothetical protein [unclassified Colwellia]MBU2924018.1 hypothetical protein [Colwellia sp. C2M11]MDO6488744.1 hypothetical protein [Colwellia sp. 6_MG-2023]MDO6507880.1 hypothetical protein [Colwellia sp. 5_MG-2023]MDO6556567.1 hypothetical protein [Colwellia sp. 4_MG-2023]MDO6653613.1 hypothetical protein [Colwellia sp. 3_MG-2023]
MKIIQLFNGEFSAENAPKAQLDNGSFCIPQHYLKYRHTLASVEELILKISYCDRYPIFVSEDNQGIYIQVGIIGADNYKGNNYESHSILHQNQKSSDGVSAVKDKKLKIMYGRKWRVEPKLPSAEIIQTAFLAIKKVREHEVRELFRLKAFNKTTTPLNCHHDVTMLINSQEIRSKETEISWLELQQELDNLRYEQAKFQVINIENRHEKYWILELKVCLEASSHLDEIEHDQLIVLIINKLTFNNVCYQLMAELIRLSDRHVDENFMFSCVPRFSQKNDIKAIAKISANTRELHKSAEKSDFEEDWRKENYQVDLARVPQLNTSVFSERIRNILNSFNGIEGILPENT